MGTVSPINGHIDYTWPEWISVDFKLPEESGEYLCYTDKGSLMVLPFSKVHKLFNSYDLCDDEDELKMCIQVTHWMPLPPLPQED